ncbi:ATP binding microtubule motor family protein isoform 2 [Hibiscus syriacus]|uniref:ATP binding microtubule motor family protein isoform 2 n=1 Tax=Hibiscus syriacus TaxID=106335 RepID=A0A6A3B2K0_HIBSY|nr:ATP binding microtubule motor family protein isoform 2 [Hibiscus syriacus]
MVGTPATPLCKIQRTPAATPGGGAKVREEKILVTVRMRPLNQREQEMYDLITWDCVDDHTIVFKNPNHARPANQYSFGILSLTLLRKTVLKLSAMEIYNETVVDLLKRDPDCLRLLDDPEKGTIVEKLVEEVVKDSQHLKHLTGICEARRQVGETTLNDKSSMSHQIIRLTIESSLRGNAECVKSYLASLGFKTYKNTAKLTWGNDRTAIICTISPALSHVEQTRNTLSFATNAKEVINNAHVNMTSTTRPEKPVEYKKTYLEINNAHVNMIVSDKRLVKRLQKEVAKLEARLRTPESTSASCLQSLLMEKEMKILEMEREMEELKRQHSLLEEERKACKVQKFHHLVTLKLVTFQGSNRYGPSGKGSATMTDPSMIVHEIRKLEQRQRQLSEEAKQAIEVLHKEVSSHRLGNKEAAEAIVKMLSEIKDMQAVSSIPEDITIGKGTNLKEEITRFNSQGCTIGSIEKKLKNVQKSIDMHQFQMDIENKVPEDNEIVSSRSHRSPGSFKTPPRKADDRQVSSREGTPSTTQTNSVDVKKMQRMFKDATEENIRSIRTYVTELKEQVAKLQHQKQLLVCQVLELEEAKEAGNDETDSCFQSPMPWHIVFVDQRRLTWLEQQFAELGNANLALLGDEPASLVASSIKALKQEREYLAKRGELGTDSRRKGTACP